MKKIVNNNVFLVCTGLGNVNRGYESFTQECFDALKGSGEYSLYLLKGAGSSNVNEVNIPHLKRKNRLAVLLGKLIGKDSYFIEQLTFCIGMLPLLIKKRPTVVFYSDFILGTFLWHLRRWLRFKYKLLYSNGAPNGPPYTRTDHVQQLLPYYLSMAQKAGEPVSKHTLLPYGIKMPQNNVKPSPEIEEIKAKAKGRRIILSVGAVNKRHKRMDYIVQEFAKLNGGQFFLIILGQFEEETVEVKALASSLLNEGDFIIDNVSLEKVGIYYMTADYFVLASLWEGFGRVLLEAACYGLPVIVHDYVIAREVLGETAVYIDMKQPGALADKVNKLALEEWRITHRVQQIEYIRNRFSWDILTPDYYKLILGLVKNVG